LKEKEQFMDLQLVRRRTVHLFVEGNQAVANDVAAYVFEKPARIVGVKTCLRNIGATSGATTVDGKLNGVSIFSTVPSIAFNATSKERYDAASSLPTGVTGSGGVLTPVFGEPTGVRVHPGDRYRVDVTAIPGTPSVALSVYLELVEEDV
jgi:hypothetical protein